MNSLQKTSSVRAAAVLLLLCLLLVSTLSVAVPLPSLAAANGSRPLSPLLSGLDVQAAKSYYVHAGSGADSNPGTLDRPFKTIAKAASRVGPGDVVFLREGTYREPIKMNKSGTAGAPITFKAYENERVAISGAAGVGGWSGPDAQGIYTAQIPTADLQDANLKSENYQVFVDGQMVHQAREPEIADHSDPFSQQWLETPMIKGVAVNIKTAKGKWIRALDGGDDDVVADAAVPGQWGEFYLIDTNGGKLKSGDKVGFLTSDHRHYLTAEGGGSTDGSGPTDRLVANRHEFGTWETYTIGKIASGGEIHSGDKISLRAFKGGYLSAPGLSHGYVYASSASVGAIEEFTITIHPQSLVLFDENEVDFSSGGDAWAGSIIWGPFGAHWSLDMAKISASAPGKLTLGDTDEWWNSWGWSHGKGAIIGGLNALDTENEWHFIKDGGGTGGKLYYMPPAGQNPANQDVELRQRMWAADVTGSHIVISNIDFFAGQLRLKGDNNVLDNISVTYGTHFVFRKTIGQYNGYEDGNNGVYIEGDGNTVKNSEIAYSSGNGMSVIGDRNEVHNCLIHDFGTMGTYTSGVFFDGTGSKLTHSTLFNSGRDILHLAECAGCEITYNLLHDSTLLTDDSGVIYSFGRDLKNTEIAYNWIQGVTDPTRDISSLHLGIYLDNGSRNARVHHNLISGLANKPGVGPNTPHEGHLICNNTIIHEKSVDAEGKPVKFDKIGEYAYCNCNFDKQEKYFSSECKHDAGSNVTGVCVNPDYPYWMDPARLKVFNTQYFASFNEAATELVNPQAVLTKENGWEIIGNPDFRPKAGSALIDANDAGSACNSVIDEVTGAAPDRGAYEHKGTNWIPGYRAVPRSGSGLFGYASSHFGNAVRLDVQGEYAYVADWSGSLNTFDISDPNRPVLLGSAQDTGNEFQDVAVEGDYAYVANDYYGLAKYDISDPKAPRRVDARHDGTGPATSVALGAGQYAYVGHSYSADSEFATYNLAAFPGTAPNFYAPQFAQHRDIYAVDVAGDHVYVCASDGYGNVRFQVLDRKGSPGSPRFLGSLDLPAEKYGYGCEVRAEGGFAYLSTVGSSTHDGGLLVVDIRRPTVPVVVGEVYISDSHTVPWKYPGLDVAGDEVYMMARDRLCAFDVSDPLNPAEIDCYPFPAAFGNTDGGDVVIHGDFAIAAVAKHDPAAAGDHGGLAVYKRSPKESRPLGDPEPILNAGEYHTCALKGDGGADCWGAENESNDHGQAAGQAGPFVQVGAGALHSCGLQPDGSVDCWGTDAWYGQGADQPGPFSQLAVGVSHNCGLKPDGSAACWGADWAGQAQSHNGPFVQLSAGFGHTCGLTPGGRIDCWGSNDFGQAADKFGPFTQVSAGWYDTCGLKADGSIDCWGDHPNWQSENLTGPYAQVSVGSGHACGLKQAGGIDCWGDNNFGEAADQGGSFTRVSAGRSHTCGLMADGSASCWGWNEDGQANDQPGPYGPYEESKAINIDVAVTMYKNLTTEASRKPYETIIANFADAVYEASNGARKLGTVTFYAPGVTHSQTDINWVEKCHPSAKSVGSNWLHVNMCDIFENAYGDGRDYNFLDSEARQKFAGYVMTHEWGHYYFGLYDEYTGIAEWDSDPAAPHSDDTPVPNSIMNRATTVHPQWANFSVAKNFNTENAQYRVFGASGWDTLARPATEDPRDSWRVSLPNRPYHADLKDYAPQENAEASVELPTTAARSELSIVWDSATAENKTTGLANGSPFTVQLDSILGREIAYPDPILLLAFVQKDLPLSGLGVKGRVLLPGGGSAPLSFTDDGRPPDAEQGDGLYSAILPYSKNGVYTIRVDFDNHAAKAVLVTAAFEPAAGVDGKPIPMPPPVPVSEDFTLSSTSEVKVIGVVADDFGDTPADAQPIAATNEPYSGKIDRPGDKDVFKIKTPAGETTTIRVSNLALGMQPKLRVLGSDGKKVLSESGLNITFDNYLFIPLNGVAPGTTVYAEVSDGSGTASGGLYELSAGASVASDTQHAYMYLPIMMRRES